MKGQAFSTRKKIKINIVTYPGVIKIQEHRTIFFNHPDRKSNST